MKHKEKFKLLIIVLILLMILTGCYKIIYRPYRITLPDKPILPEVKVSAAQNGIYLDIANARKLGERLILLQSYIEKLEIRIKINNNNSQ